MSHRLLIVEDDLKLARTLGRGLAQEGYVVDLAHTGEQALAQADAHDYDVLVLDVMLPGLGGRAVCRALRDRGRQTPVLMLTALDHVEDRIRGLDSGADDYLVKPFDFGELLARLRALIRRGPGQRPVMIELGGLRADPITRVVSWGDDAVTLTSREFDLLATLLRRPRVVIPRRQLLEQVWGENYAGSPNVVDVYVGYLRRKLSKPPTPVRIRTVRGAGFVLEPS